MATSTFKTLQRLSQGAYGSATQAWDALTPEHKALLAERAALLDCLGPCRNPLEPALVQQAQVKHAARPTHYRPAHPPTRPTPTTTRGAFVGEAVEDRRQGLKPAPLPIPVPEHELVEPQPRENVAVFAFNTRADLNPTAIALAVGWAQHHLKSLKALGEAADALRLRVGERAEALAGGKSDAKVVGTLVGAVGSGGLTLEQGIALLVKHVR